ncbi:MAG TPA: thioether cross-link-forming SCIFF peptide maturase, partial [Firmicutes bacterium]|nr:thioether cross-link-forming SCIFF peptide maturase [Bacillota bacterium]
MTQRPNYHLFSHGGLNILLDVPTGAVHVLDDIAARVLPYLAAGHEREVLQTEFSAAEIAEAQLAWEQLQQLADQGMLFNPEPHFNQRPGGGQLKALCLHVAHDCDLRCRYCFAS